MSHGQGDWNQLLLEHKAVQIQRDLMRSTTIGQSARDQAAMSYARGCDRIVDLLDMLSTRLVLGRVAQLMAREDQP